MQEFEKMNDQKKRIIWEEWEKGIPMNIIGKKIKKTPATIFSYLRYHGGIQPRKRRRRANALSLNERAEISRVLASGQSVRSIASNLGCSPSTISREIKN